MTAPDKGRARLTGEDRTLLRRGLRNPGGRLPLFRHSGRRVERRVYRKFQKLGLAAPCFAPRRIFTVWRLTDAGRKLAAGMALALVVAAAPDPAGAQQTICGDADALGARITEIFGEEARAGGLSAAGNLVTLWRTEDGASWTLVVTHPDGWACLLGSGTEWQELPAPAAPEPEGANG